MVTEMIQKKVHTFKLNFSEEKTTAFGGLFLEERMASKLSLWRVLEERLPKRKHCSYDWLTVIKAVSVGLLSGSRGTVAAEEVREDKALLELLSLEGAPEEATVWRALEGLGELQKTGLLPEVQAEWTRRILARARRKDLLRHGFFPVFADGTLLEGSARREGTKYIEQKGKGLLWSAVFTGPMIAAQRIAGAGEGEPGCIRAMIPAVNREVVKPLKLRKKALVLVDSLHGDGPTLDIIEREKLHYIAGANKLGATQTILESQPDCVWESLGTNPERGWSRMEVCVCRIECDGWGKKRRLVGLRWMSEGEFLWQYAGVITDVGAADVRHLKNWGSYARIIWRLYGMKAGLEDYFKDVLEDLGLHHPPCTEVLRNAGFYAVASLAHTVGRGVDLLGGKSGERGSVIRKDGKRRKRRAPMRMRLWKVRRRLFALPGRVSFHARVLQVTILGVSAAMRKQFERYYGNICRC